MRCFFILLIIAMGNTVLAQNSGRATDKTLLQVDTLSVKDSLMPPVSILDVNPRIFRQNDSGWVASGICKPLRVKKAIHAGLAVITSPSLKRQPDLSVHGSVQYDFLYRSLIDTPYYQKDFRQHAVSVNLNIAYKDAYPVRLAFQFRTNNSPYFSNIADVSVRFTQKEYINNLKSILYKQLSEEYKIANRTGMPELEKRYANKLTEVKAIEQWLSSPARLQEIIAEKERLAKGNLSLPADVPGLNGMWQLPATGMEGIPGLPDPGDIKNALNLKARHIASAEADSVLARMKKIIAAKIKAEEDSLLATKTAANIETQKERLSRAKKELKELEKKWLQVQKGFNDSLLKLKQEIAGIRDMAALKRFVAGNKSASGKLPKNWKTVSALEQVGIGRNWIDYSELTVKNISLTGINVEANPGNFYFAVAAGNINYRFRDFVSQKPGQRIHQPLYLLRAGIGRKDGNSFILSWYDGKRNVLNPVAPAGTDIHPQRIVGIAAESRIRINENQFFSLEFAKSSFPATTGANQAPINRVKNFKDRSNEAWAVRISNYWPDAGARLNGFYRKAGEHFQSFTLQPLNSRQESYQLRYQQQLWNKKFLIDAGIRKNDFDNPFITPGLSSHTVFKSFQLSLKIPKYPFVTVGFTPSSQFTILDNRQIAENRYNTLNATMTYAYRARKINMASNALFLKFYNNSPDTGFIYYNASTFSFQQFIYAGRWQLQSGISISGQQEYKIFTLEQSASIQVRDWLSLSGGMKYNKYSGAVQWGSSAGMNLVMRKIGAIRLSYDKSYLPDNHRNLLPVTMGRVGLFRSF